MILNAFLLHADRRSLASVPSTRGTAWSETVKRLWDEDTRAKHPLKDVLLGSAPLLIAQGLTESLAGRFETTTLTHRSFPEMRAAFGWSRYVIDSLIANAAMRGDVPPAAHAARRR